MKAKGKPPLPQFSIDCVVIAQFSDQSVLARYLGPIQSPRPRKCLTRCRIRLLEDEARNPGSVHTVNRWKVRQA